MLSRRRLVRLLGSLPFLAAAPAARSQTGGFYYRGPVTDHFDGERFFNTGGEPPRGFGAFLDWQFSGKAKPWPAAYPSPYQDRPPAHPHGDLRVTLVGHATFLIQIAGANILTDPIWSERASPVPFAGPRRYNAPGIPFESLPPIDLVLVSHNHYDHMDLPTLRRLWQRDRPRIVAPLGNDAIVRAYDPAIPVTALDWGQALAVGGLRITAEPAHHWSARATNDRNHALWASFVIRGGGRAVYFAGDTGFGGGRHFRHIASRHRGIDLALLPIGAYEPRWFMAPQHMNPADAVEALRILGARAALGYHWGTFRLTDEAVDDPPRDLARALAERGIPERRFLAMRPGQVWPSGAGDARQA
jgi:L-ascorbate metabolism protein UlaG (beta-lactamase superfamily)